MLALGAAGYAVAGAYGAAIGAGAGLLVQQAGYSLVVVTLWHGWSTRAIAFDGTERSEQLARISLRAFTLWMRTATASDRLYIALWNVGSNEGEENEVAGSMAEIRIRYAYALEAWLDNEPLWCDSLHRRQLRCTLQRDEARLLQIATGEPLKK